MLKLANSPDGPWTCPPVLARQPVRERIVLHLYSRRRRRRDLQEFMEKMVATSKTICSWLCPLTLSWTRSLEMSEIPKLSSFGLQPFEQATCWPFSLVRRAIHGPQRGPILFLMHLNKRCLEWWEPRRRCGALVRWVFVNYVTWAWVMNFWFSRCLRSSTCTLHGGMPLLSTQRHGFDSDAPGSGPAQNPTGPVRRWKRQAHGLLGFESPFFHCHAPQLETY